MIKVGLTGGYASGKSFVAAELERLGCHVVYADKLGHAVLQPGGEAYAPTVAAFGPDILHADGAIDRKRLASLVFRDPDLLAKLNGFVHPAVFRLEQLLIEQFAGVDPAAVIIIEAAILIETGRYRSFDALILTACSEEVQIARGMTRDQLTRDQVLARLKNQMPLEQKKAYADYVIDTGLPQAQTISRVREVFEDLERRSGASA